MRNISDTIRRMGALRAKPAPAGARSGDRLSDLTGFGSNPGALRARTYIPDGLPRGAPLVVVLHGCTQTAAGYDHGSGWSRLADREGFALLFPEQQRANNVNLCFNWFVPADVSRDSGEAHSIRQMIEAVAAEHGLDRKRVFVTGLSAGGAMACAMLAAYPEIFSGGAIIAGLPYGVAATVPEAFDRMRGHGMPSEAELQARLRAASRHKGPWPKLSIWHGSADRTVDPVNSEAIIGQWRKLHGLALTADRTETIGLHHRRVWLDANGHELVEAYGIAGMGHGTPVDGARGFGQAAPFMLDVGISSTLRIARFWGIAAAAREEKSGEQRDDGAKPRKAAAGEPASPHASSKVGKVIEDALRAAGLMR